MTVMVLGTGCPRGRCVEVATGAPPRRAGFLCWAKSGPQERWVLTSGTCGCDLVQQGPYQAAKDLEVVVSLGYLGGLSIIARVLLRG